MPWVHDQGFPGESRSRYAAAGRRADAEKLAAASAGFPAREALIYSGLGDKDRAFDALDRMAAANDPRVGAYFTYPELAVLRGERPRHACFRPPQ